MTLRIVRALLGKEAMRWWHNRPALVLAMLLVLVSILVSLGHERGRLGSPARSAVCYVLYWNDDEFVGHLKGHLPRDLDVRVAPASEFLGPTGVISYSAQHPATPIVSIQIRPLRESLIDRSEFRPGAEPSSLPKYKIWYWYPENEAEALLPFRDWFHVQLREFFDNRPTIVEAASSFEDPAGRILPIHRVVAGLVAAAVYLLCFHLNIVITSEERERRTLTAQMLAPVSVGDLIVAKVCFYVPATLALAAVVLIINFPDALRRPLFWVAMIAACIGYLSIGLIICSVTRSQSSAGLMALAYFLTVGIVIYLGTLMPVFVVLQVGLLDFHLMQCLHGHFLTPPPAYLHWITAAVVVLSAIWAFIAVRVLMRRGWH